MALSPHAGGPPPGEPSDPTSASTRVYDALKWAIARMDIYARPDAVRLEETGLARELGISRTPIRKAMAFLEKEGIVRSIPYRGVFVVRRTRREIIEMITVWAAMEGLAARRIAEAGAAEDVAALHATLAGHHGATPGAGYRDANNRFHEAMIQLGRSPLIDRITDRLAFHVQPIRRLALAHEDRLRTSMADHRAILRAIERGEGERAEALVRRHSLGLAAHVEAHGGFLDRPWRV